MKKIFAVLMAMVVVLVGWILVSADTPEIMVKASWDLYDNSVAPNEQVTHIEFVEVDMSGNTISTVIDSIPVEDIQAFFPWPADGKTTYFGMYARSPNARSDLSEIARLDAPDYRKPSAVLGLILEAIE